MTQRERPSASVSQVEPSFSGLVSTTTTKVPGDADRRLKITPSG